ncbi:MAG: tetratricopeptide repeat protein [Armatimonadota bacterium]
MSHGQNTTESGRSRASSAKLTSLMKRASALVEQGMYEEAIENLKKAMALSPRDPRFSLRLADVYRAQNRMEPAIKALKNAVELDPLNCAANEQLLRTLLELGRYDEAISESCKLIQRSPKSIFARDILGIAYLQQGMIDKALHVTNELIRIDPTDPAHHFKKAVLLQQKGEVSEAVAVFIRVVEMDPDGEMAEDARDAIAALDGYQIQQVLTLAAEDAVFKAKLAIDPESALADRGFRLSPVGIITLRQIDLNELRTQPHSLYRH